MRKRTSDVYNGGYDPYGQAPAKKAAYGGWAEQQIPRYDPYGVATPAAPQQDFNAYGAYGYGAPTAAPNAYGFPPAANNARRNLEHGDRCRHWAMGHCNLGDECKFKHDGTQGDKKRCRHWAARGTCSMGDTCKFDHNGVPGDTPYPDTPRNPPAVQQPPPMPPMQAPSPYAPYADPYYQPPPPHAHAMGMGPFGGPPMMGGLPPHMGAKSTSPCRHFTRGHCNLGFACKFSHNPPRPKFAHTCRHWGRGHCRLGEACSFAHPEAEKGTANGTTEAEAAGDAEAA